MRKTMTAAALGLLALLSVLSLQTTAASAQAAAQGCPPGQPSGFPPGTPPNSPAPATGRPNYPPGRCQFGLSQNAAKRGETFTATGNGFVPGETVVLSIAGVRAASATAGADGAFSAAVTVPSSAPIGPTQVLASGQSQELSAAFEVLGAGAVPGVGSGTLPRTGDEVVPAAVVGVLLVAGGAFAVAATRRRRTA